jgi:membrane-associated phospholipid phosphatase
MMRVARSRAVCAIVAMLVGPARLEAQSDTITPPRQLFTWRDGVLGAAFVVATISIAPLDKHVAQRLQDKRNQQNTRLQTASKGFRFVAFPGTAIIGASMYTAGRITRSHRAADLGLHGTEALLIGEVLAAGIKGVFGRQRPYVDPEHLDPYKWHFLGGFVSDDGQRSFPSGHAVAAFSAAAAVTSETSRWWPDSRWIIGPTLYGGAGMVGLSRMYDNRHWASDVIMGAAIGTFAGNKVVRYHHSHPGNRLDQWLVNFSITPSGAGHAVKATILPRVGPMKNRGAR